MEDNRYQNIINKLNTYIEEYSNLLKENIKLKEELEEEKNKNKSLEKQMDKCKTVVEETKKTTLETMEKSEKILQKTDEYREHVNLTFIAIGEILDIMIERDEISRKEIEILKDRIEELKDNLES